MATASTVRASFLLTLLVACATDSGTLPSQPGPALRILAQRIASDWSPWSDPVHLDAPINSPCQDQTPTLSRDQLALYFMSNRRGGLGADTPDGCQDTFDLWVARRASHDSPWETPVNLGSPVNTPVNEAGPALSPDGRLLFFYRWEGAGGQRDIYVARRAHQKQDMVWEAPVNLGPDVNTTDTEEGPSYLRHGSDGTAVLFFDRGATSLATDIYSVPVDRNGMPRGPALPVSELNSSVEDNHASVRADRREANAGRPSLVFLSVRRRTLPLHSLRPSCPYAAGPVSSSSRSSPPPCRRWPRRPPLPSTPPCSPGSGGVTSGLPTWAVVSRAWPAFPALRRRSSSPARRAGSGRPPTPERRSDRCSTTSPASRWASWRSRRATRCRYGRAPARKTPATRSPRAAASSSRPTAGSPGSSRASRRPAPSAASWCTRPTRTSCTSRRSVKPGPRTPSAGSTRPPTVARRGSSSSSSATRQGSLISPWTPPTPKCCSPRAGSGCAGPTS